MTTGHANTIFLRIPGGRCHHDHHRARAGGRATDQTYPDGYLQSTEDTEDQGRAGATAAATATAR